MSVPQLSKKELKLLDKVVPPSGKTIEMLAAQHVNYCSIQGKCAIVLQRNPDRVRQMSDAIKDPRTRPPQAVVVSEPGARFRLGQAGEPGTDERVKHTIAGYEEYLAKEPKTFEDTFWRAQYAVSAALVHREYLVLKPLADDPTALRAFFKRTTQLHKEMMRRDFPHVFADTAAFSQSTQTVYQAPESSRRGAHASPMPSRSSDNIVLNQTCIAHTEAINIANDLNNLGRMHFKTLKFQFTDEAQPEDNFDEGDDVDSWTVVSVGLNPVSYDVVFLSSQTPISHTQEDLIELLMKSCVV